MEKPRVETRSIVEPARPVMMRSEMPRVEQRETTRFVSPPTQSVRFDAPRVENRSAIQNREVRYDGPVR